MHCPNSLNTIGEVGGSISINPLEAIMNPISRRDLVLGTGLAGIATLGNSLSALGAEDEDEKVKKVLVPPIVRVVKVPVRIKLLTAPPRRLSMI